LKSGQGAQAPAFDLVIVEPRPDEQDQRFELSERVRDKSLDGFIEIDAEVYQLPPNNAAKAQEQATSQTPSPVRYRSNRLVDEAFSRWAEKLIAEQVYEKRIASAGVNAPLSKVKQILVPVKIDEKELTRKNAQGDYVDGPEENKVLLLMVPFGLLMLMFMVV